MLTVDPMKLDSPLIAYDIQVEWGLLVAYDTGKGPTIDRPLVAYPVRDVYSPLLCHELQHATVGVVCLPCVCQLEQHRVAVYK